MEWFVDVFHEELKGNINEEEDTSLHISQHSFSLTRRNHEYFIYGSQVLLQNYILGRKIGYKLWKIVWRRCCHIPICMVLFVFHLWKSSVIATLHIRQKDWLQSFGKLLEVDVATSTSLFVWSCLYHMYNLLDVWMSRHQYRMVISLKVLSFNS